MRNGQPQPSSLICGDAADIMETMPDGSIDLIVTSPPYWDAVEYEHGRAPWATYEDYLDDMIRVWGQCARVLRPNGKLCINTPIMPIPKSTIKQHTRHLKNIAFDTEQKILSQTCMERFSLFIWQKQTSKMMFGSYPYPGNILENNTIEFINVYVKPGKPPKFAPELKEANRLSRFEWLDLTQQIWFMYPEDIKRKSGHPAPFPIKLPSRLMRLYTYSAHSDFPGEIVLDPFVGLGTTCVAAKMMGRQYIGIDVNKNYIDIARQRIVGTAPFQPLLIVGRPKYPGKEDLIELAKAEAETSGKNAEKKHKRKTYGRSVPLAPEDQLNLL